MKISDDGTTSVADESVMDFDPILDIPVKINANLGRVRISVSELLQLDAGSVLELDKDVGSPIDLYVNDQLVAKGEVILINDKLGISILDIVSESLSDQN